MVDNPAVPANRIGVLVGWAAVATAGLALAGGGASQTAAQEPAPADLDRGGALYQRWCATCHATDGSGTPDGPPIAGLSVAHVDLTMRTGRMPLHDPGRGVRTRGAMPGEERDLVVAYLTDLLDLPGGLHVPATGDAARGHDVYVAHCAQCHGATGSGGVVGDGTLAPRVRGLDPVAVAGATRVGPFEMPPFGPETVDDGELDDLVAFLGDDVAPATLLGLTELHRVAAGAFAALLLAGAVLACMWTGWPIPSLQRKPENPDA